MSTKRWISADELLLDSLRLARRVLQSGWHPQLLIGLWRGGASIAVAMHEALAWHGEDCAHLPLKTALYSGIDSRAAALRIEGLDVISAHLQTAHRVLLIDDVFDTGQTMEGVRDALARQAPTAELRIATVWWKPERNRTTLRPDWHLHETAEWLVFPHELQGLELEELRAARGAEFADALSGDA